MSKKVKSSENKAKVVETKQGPTKTSEELGFLLDQNWQQLFSIQANIQAIKKELEIRHLRMRQEKDDSR